MSTKTAQRVVFAVLVAASLLMTAEGIIRFRKLDFAYKLNPEYWNMTFESENLTHIGAMTLTIHKPIQELLMHLTVDSSNQKFVDYEFDVCQWSSKIQINFMINYFTKYIEEFYNPELLRCPIRPGRYEMAAPKPRISDPAGIAVSLISISGNITVTAQTKTIVDGEIVQLGNTTETLEFY